MTPLIDVVFQLLIFLMVTSQFTKPEAVVDLPQAQGEAATVDPNKEKVTIAIQEDGSVIVDEEVVSMSDLPILLRTTLSSMDKRRVEIRGDRESQFGRFVEIMEIARESGAGTIGVVKQAKDGK